MEGKENLQDYSSIESEESSVSEEFDFFEGMTEEQQKMFREKLNGCQKQFRVYNDNQRKQKVDDIVCRFSDVDAKAAEIALDSCNNNELLAIRRLHDDASYKQTVLDMSTGKCERDIDSIMYIDKRCELLTAFQEVDESLAKEEMDETENWEMTYPDIDFSLLRKRKNVTTHSEHKSPRLMLDDALTMVLFLSLYHELTDLHTIDDSNSNPPPRKRVNRKVRKVIHSDESSEFDDVEPPQKVTHTKEASLLRALSGEAAEKIPTNTLRQLGWSEARIKAFRNREKNPNQYYYRFNDPGEPQATGKWSQKDKELFLRLIKEKGVDYQWGIFSMQIPGRVGYQCSNFYRQLIKDGEIEDENYVLNSHGKLCFRFRDKQGRSTLARHKHRDEFDYLEPFDLPPVETENVLPDYIDPMTMMPVEKPAISPYGHVMGYDSWVKLLNRSPKNTCPFTKKKLTRRSLVKLTSENIDEYRDKIINANGFDIDFNCNS